MREVTLGRRPEYLRLRLVRGDRFHLLATREEPWEQPPVFVFSNNTSWVSAIQTSNEKIAKWDIPEGIVGLLPTDRRLRVKLRWDDITWAEGTVELV